MGQLTDVSLRIAIGRDVVIHPISEISITPAGYDLTAGLVFILSSDKPRMKNIPGEGQHYVVPPKTSVFIRTKEHVWLSQNVMATIHARGSLAARGLFINSTTVDPNWEGQMTCLVHNVNDHEEFIPVEMRFATMVLHQVADPTNVGPGTNPRRVANVYLERYGERFAKLLTASDSTNEASAMSVAFNKMVSYAKKPSLGSIVSGALSEAKSKISTAAGERGRTIFVSIVAFLSVMMMAIAVYPAILIHLGFVQSVEGVDIVARLGLFVGGLAILQRISK